MPQQPATPVKSHRPDIRLPRTSTRRSSDSFVKLITRVDPFARMGFGFQGTFHPPGSYIRQNQIPPGGLALECAGKWKTGRHQQLLYILWQFAPATRGWAELARCLASSWEWAVQLRDTAVNALQPTAEHQIESLTTIAGLIRQFLDTQLKQLDKEQQCTVLGIVHDELASRLAHALPERDIEVVVRVKDGSYAD
jgi:hypothetical protein